MNSSRYIFAFVFAVLSVGGVAPVFAYAQNCANGDATDASGNSCYEVTAQTPSAGPATRDSKAVGTPADGDLSKVFGPVMGTIMDLFAALTGYAGVLLNDAVVITVLQMGQYVDGLKAVDVVWRIMRDLGNIVLIFGFIAIGVCTIVGVNWYGGGTKMLPMLLLAAVFLNFSLFISEAVIDVGNVFATQFYTQINGGQPPVFAEVFTFKTGRSINEEGISNTIMQSLGLQTLYNINGGKATSLSNWNATTMFVGFLGIILFIITAFVLFSLAFILISRFVILLLLIIIAPIGFAGLAVPKLKGYADQWWEQLFKQTLTAPVLLLMLYVALAVITDAKFIAGGNSSSNAAASGYRAIFENPSTANINDFGNILLSFVVGMGLLLACVYLAKSMSAFGAGWAVKMGGKFSFGAIAHGASAVFGGSALLARKGLQRAAPNSAVARNISKFALKPLERARFDMRSAGVGAALGAAGLSEAASPIAKSTVGRVQQVGEYFEKRGKEEDRAWQQNTVIPRLNTASRLALQTGDHRQVASILASMNDKDFESSAGQRALANNPLAAALLPQTRYEKVQQSSEISDAMKATIDAARRNGNSSNHAQSRFDMDATRVYGPTLPGGTTPHPYAGQTRGEALIRGMNTTARGRIPADVLTTNTAAAGAPPVYVPNVTALNLLDGSDFNAIRTAGELSDAQKIAIGTYINGIIGGPPTVPGSREASIVLAASHPNFETYYRL